MVGQMDDWILSNFPGRTIGMHPLIWLNKWFSCLKSKYNRDVNWFILLDVITFMKNSQATNLFVMRYANTEMCKKSLKVCSQLHMISWSIIIMSGVDWTHLVDTHYQWVLTAKEFYNIDEGLMVTNIYLNIMVTFFINNIKLYCLSLCLPACLPWSVFPLVPLDHVLTEVFRSWNMFTYWWYSTLHLMCCLQS